VLGILSEAAIRYEARQHARFNGHCHDQKCEPPTWFAASFLERLHVRTKGQRGTAPIKSWQGHQWAHCYGAPFEERTATRGEEETET
jgi:hypothetical protein